MSTRRLEQHRTPIALAMAWIVACGIAGAARCQEGAAPGEPPPAPTAAPASAPLSDEERSAAIGALDPKYRKWLQEVRGLMSFDELDYFLRLREDFRRDAFMEAFWLPRDPDRRTARNELKERWLEYRTGGGDVPYDDARYLLLLFNGPPTGWSLPDGRPVARCFSRSTELEIWYYTGSERTDRKFAVIIQRRGPEVGYEVYRLGQSLRPMQRSGGLPTTEIQQLCADELLRYTIGEMAREGGYDQLLDEVMAPPLPSPEWLANFKASATDLPDGAETFDVDLELTFPARKQSRTAVQAMVAIPLDRAPGRVFDGQLFHNFQLVGEVIKDGKLFEGFRYRFEGPTPEGVAAVPVGFTRFLRPGTVSLRLLIEDLYGGRFAQVIREVEVPSPDGLEPVPAAVEAERSSGPSLRLYVPQAKVHVGQMRFRAQAEGDFDKVTFYLDDQSIFSKRKPPYSVELDLGSTPEPHRVRVVGFDADGVEVATDQVWLNQGAQRFRVRLIEPRAGGIYPGSVTARAEVETPDGSPPARLEIYLGDELAATLVEPPFAHSLRLADDRLAVVRAVAYLADGSSSEDAVVINTASTFVETVEVRLVELPVLVTDRDGRPIRGLSQERFRVFEDGVEQRPQRFEEAGGLPIQAALLIDRSASMEPHLERVTGAALSFLEAAVTAPEERVAVLSFADRVTVDAGFAAGPGQAERALAGIDALGGTALYDSLVEAFNTFEGLEGPSALLLFSDGQDETSRLTFEQTLETARRSGVTLYAIGMAEAFPDRAARKVLEELAEETGGEAFFLAGLDRLGGVYAEILEKLRARYLVAYQPSSGRSESEYREVRVEVDEKGATVRTRRGYYP